jgi:hypothetical protein
MRIDNELVQFVWDRARVVPELDAAEWRMDECGAWLQRRHYRDEASEFGWKILDVVADRNDDPETLRPFHIRNSYDVEHGRPVCLVCADRRDVAPGTRVDEPRNVDVPGRSGKGHQASGLAKRSGA